MPTVINGTTGVSQVQDGTIATADIIDGAVTTAKLADSNVTTSKIADSNVTSSKLANNAVTTEKITDGSVTSAKIAAGAIDSQVKASVNASGDAPVFGCRAWVNFDATKDSTGVTSTSNTNRFIRASGNISSVARNAAGDFTINFTTAMPDANYAIVFGVNSNGASSNVQGSIVSTTLSTQATLKTSAQIRVQVGQTNGGSLFDVTEVNIAVFR